MNSTPCELKTIGHFNLREQQNLVGSLVESLVGRIVGSLVGSLGIPFTKIAVPSIDKEP